MHRVTPQFMGFPVQIQTPFKKTRPRGRVFLIFLLTARKKNGMIYIVDTKRQVQRRRAGIRNSEEGERTMKSTKSAKLRTASRLVGYIGIGACLLASCLYLLLHEVANEKLEKMLGKFDVKSLIYVGIAAAVFLVVAIILRAASSSARRAEHYAEEAEAARKAQEAAQAEAAEKAQAEQEALDAAEAEKAAAEAEDARKAEEKAAAMEGGKTFVAYIGRNIPEKQREMMVKVGEFTRKNAKVIIAVAATVAITSAMAKRKAEKETTRRRQNFFRSLGC